MFCSPLVHLPVYSRGSKSPFSWMRQYLSSTFLRCMCARPILAIKFVIFIATTRYAYSPEDTQDVPCISHQGEQAQWRSIWIHLAARSSPRSWRMLANVRQWNAHQCSSSSNRSSKSTNKHDGICTDANRTTILIFAEIELLCCVASTPYPKAGNVLEEI